MNTSVIFRGTTRRRSFVPTQRPSTVRLRASLLAEANAIVDREYASELSLDDIARRVARERGVDIPML